MHFFSVAITFMSSFSFQSCNEVVNFVFGLLLTLVLAFEFFLTRTCLAYLLIDLSAVLAWVCCAALHTKYAQYLDIWDSL